MDDIRKILQDMKVEEDELLKQRTAEDAAQVSQTHYTIVIGTLTALALAALAGFVISRNIAQPLLEVAQLAEERGVRETYDGQTHRSVNARMRWGC